VHVASVDPRNLGFFGQEAQEAANSASEVEHPPSFPRPVITESVHQCIAARSSDPLEVRQIVQRHPEHEIFWRERSG
jgi:hypothetical protein